MPELASLITAEFEESWYRTDLTALVGARSDEDLAAWVDRLCRLQLGQATIDARFVFKSVGAVFGLTLADQSGVVLKLFPPSFDESELRAIENVLSHVVETGFPATNQLGPLFRTEGLWAAFYELASGQAGNAHDPEVRRTSARALAEFTRIVIGLDPSDLPVAPTRRKLLWPPPHRVVIDLSAPGGEWIDARAEAGQRVIHAAEMPLLAAHMDWSMANALFIDERRISAILDWDSLMQASEAEMVGRAAALFTAGSPCGAQVPSRDEASAFVDEYQSARGRSFDAIEQRVLNASADYALAQVGRHGHSGPECPDDEYRRALRETASKPLVSFSSR